MTYQEMLEREKVASKKLKDLLAEALEELHRREGCTFLCQRIEEVLDEA